MDLQQARKKNYLSKDKETKEIASQLEAARQDLMQREDKNSQLLKQIKRGSRNSAIEAQNGLKVVDEVEVNCNSLSR